MRTFASSVVIGLFLLSAGAAAVVSIPANMAPTLASNVLQTDIFQDQNDAGQDNAPINGEVGNSNPGNAGSEGQSVPDAPIEVAPAPAGDRQASDMPAADGAGPVRVASQVLNTDDYTESWRQAGNDNGLDDLVRSHQVRLSTDGSLRGRIRTRHSISGSLVPVRNTPLYFLRQGSVQARTITDSDGQFNVSNLGYGTYSLIAGDMPVSPSVAASLVGRNMAGGNAGYSRAAGYSGGYGGGGGYAIGNSYSSGYGRMSGPGYSRRSAPAYAAGNQYAQGYRAAPAYSYSPRSSSTAGYGQPSRRRNAAGFLAYALHVIPADFQAGGNAGGVDIQIDSHAVPPQDIPAVWQQIRSYIAREPVAVAPVEPGQGEIPQLLQQVLQSGTAASTIRGHDVHIQPDGSVIGRVRYLHPETGRSIVAANVNASFIRNGRVIKTTMTDNRGLFRVEGLRSGIYSMVAAGNSSNVANQRGVREGFLAFSFRLLDAQRVSSRSRPAERYQFVSASDRLETIQMVTAVAAQPVPELDCAMINVQDLFAWLAQLARVQPVPRPFGDGGMLGGGGPLGPYGPGGYGAAGGGYGGGLGGGGGGLGGGGLLEALLLGGAAAGIAAALDDDGGSGSSGSGTDDEDEDMSTPFDPDP